MSDEAVFSELLREARRAAGYSQEELAERAGLSVGAIAALEQGSRRAPYRDTVSALATALGTADSTKRRLEEAAARARRRVRSDDATLPVAMTQFVERNESEELAALLACHRLVTITGSGGVGKTRTAIEVARRIESGYDHTSFVDLLPVRNGGMVVPYVAARLHLQAEPDDIAGIARFFRRRRALLLIDNCEQVIAGAADLIGSLLRECPSLTILATSREPLAISIELTYRLPSMDVAVASALFVARARAADPNLTMDPHRLGVVADICRELDGIPLAIELAASRLSTLGFQELRKRLRGELAAPGNRDLPPRHQTMDATISWSYDLLNERQQQLFRRLSVFVGSFTLEVAAAACSDDALPPESVAAEVPNLAQKSLINVEHAGTLTRYIFLDSIRTYAWKLLVKSGELEAVMLRRIQILERQAASLDAAPSMGSLVEHRTDIDGISAAVRWAEATAHYPTIVSAARIVIGFRRLWYGYGRAEEIRALAVALLNHVDANADPELAGRLLHAVAPSVEGAELLDLAFRAIPLLEETGHHARAAYLHARCSEVEAARGNRAAAERHAANAASLMRNSTPNSSGENNAVAATSAFVYALLTDYANARAALERLEITSGDPFEVEASLMLAEIEYDDGNVEKALALTQKWRFQLSRYPNADYLTVLVFGDLAKYLFGLGDRRGAEDALRRSLACALETQDRRLNVLYAKLAPYAAALAAQGGQAQFAARLLGSSESEDRRRRPLLLPKDANAHDAAISALSVALTPEQIESLRAQGSGEELRDLIEEFLAQPAAAQSAFESSTSSDRATSVIRSSPN